MREEVYQAAGLGVLRLAGLYSAKFWLRINLQNRKLIVQSCVQDSISRILEGEDMKALAPLNAVPHADSLSRSLSTEVCVTDDAADKAVIAGRNTVVIVKIELGKGRKVNLEFEFRLDKGGKPVIKAVDSLDNQNILGIKLHFVFAVVISLSQIKIVAWNFNFFSGKKVD